MNRGERREINKRKWFNKLKSVFNSKTFDWYKLQGEKGSGTSFAPHDQSINPKEWKDMLKTKDGVAYKETSTMWHNPKTEKDEYSGKKELRKRNLTNRSLTKEDKEELEKYLEDANDIFAFEKYCGACMHFNKVNECPFYNKVDSGSNWKQIKCTQFWD